MNNLNHYPPVEQISDRRRCMLMQTVVQTSTETWVGGEIVSSLIEETICDRMIKLVGNTKTVTERTANKSMLTRRVLVPKNLESRVPSLSYLSPTV
jgi:hypothetical protein